MENYQRNSIVIVEDNLLIATEIKKNLLDAGYQVAGLFDSGEELIRALGDLRCDLILMDIMLKGRLNGIDTVKQITEKRKIPFIFLTAYSDRDTLQKAQESGSLPYLIKPAGKELLISTIELTLRDYYKGNFPFISSFMHKVENGIIVLNESGKVVFINGTAQKIFDINQDGIPDNILEIIMSRFELVNAPDFIKKENLPATRSNFTHDIEFTKPFQAFHQAVLTITPIKSVRGNAFGVFFSIKLKKDSEDILILKAAEEKLKIFSEFIDMPVLIIDASANIFSANNYFTEITGIDKKEIPGENWISLISSEDETTRHSFMKYLKSDPGKLSKKYSITVKSNFEMLFRWHYTPIYNKKNSIIGYIMIGEHIYRGKIE